LDLFLEFCDKLLHGVSPLVLRCGFGHPTTYTFGETPALFAALPLCGAGWQPAADWQSAWLWQPCTADSAWLSQPWLQPCSFAEQDGSLRARGQPPPFLPSLRVIRDALHYCQCPSYIT